MPQFYFHIRTDGSLSPDDEGESFPDLAAAKEDAVAAAREIMAEDIRSHSDNIPDAIVITNKAGKELAVVKLLDALPRQLRRASD
jgi:hypothetical protein